MLVLSQEVESFAAVSYKNIFWAENNLEIGPSK